MEGLCGVERDLQEVVQIENLIVDGDTARLTMRSNFSMTYLHCIKHRGTIRAVETWRKLDGRWQLVEEQVLEPLSGYLGPDERAKRRLTRAGIGAAAACALFALVVAAGEYLWPLRGTFTGDS